MEAEPVEHEQNPSAKAFYLEAASQLHPVAEAQSAGPKGREREVREHEDAAEPCERPAYCVPASPLPALDQHER